MERGYDATSLNDIAAAVGMTKAGLYHYITSKETLLFDIITLGMNSLDEEVVEPTRDIADPQERLQQIVRRHAALATCDHGVVTVLVEEVHALRPAQRRMVNERRRQYLRYVRETLAAVRNAGGLRDVDVTVAAFSLLGMILWLPRWFRAGGTLTSEQVAADVTAIALHGVLPDDVRAEREVRAFSTPARRRLASRSFPRLNPRRFQICMTAARTLVERGYGATSMNDIAAALGVTKAGLYHHIKSKEDLFFDIVTLGMDWLNEDVIEPVASTTDPEEHLRQIVRRHARLTATNEPWITVLLDEMQALPRGQRRKIEQRKRAYFDLVRGRLRELKTAGRMRNVDPTVATYSILGMIIWIPRWMRPRGPLAPDAVAAQVADIALHGVLDAPGAVGRGKSVAVDA